MSSEHAEFPPIETAPARRTWPWAIAGAALVVTLVFALRRPPAAAEAKPAPVATAAAPAEVKPAATPMADAVKAAAIIAPTKSIESPNVLGNAVAAAKNVAMVAKAELDREIGRTKSAQAQVAAYKKQVENLEKQLGAARAQIAALQTVQKPPPPSDQEQILQTLAPVLRAGNGGSP
jgi:predicted lysophospholipase L1 biosynthesis ABC-type transport system permease subunit